MIKIANLTLIQAMTKTADLVYQRVKTLLGNKVDKISGKGLSTNDYTKTEKQKLAGIEEGAEVNQNAFGAFTVNEEHISAKSESDVLNLVAGSNVSLTGNAEGKAIVISATDTTYNVATQAASGLMSEVDKRKLDSFKNATDYALKSDITGVYTYKGSVATYAELPSTHANGDVWDVKSDGKNYAWNGTEWDDLGGVIIIDETTLTSAINQVLTD